jgi:hypothetical protein
MFTDLLYEACLELDDCRLQGFFGTRRYLLDAAITKKPPPISGERSYLMFTDLLYEACLELDDSRLQGCCGVIREILGL